MEKARNATITRPPTVAPMMRIVLVLELPDDFCVSGASLAAEEDDEEEPDGEEFPVREGTSVGFALAESGLVSVCGCWW